MGNRRRPNTFGQVGKLADACRWILDTFQVVRVGSRVSDTVRTAGRGGGGGFLSYDSQPALYEESLHQIDVFQSSRLARTTYTSTSHTLGRLEVCH